MSLFSLCATAISEAAEPHRDRSPAPLDAWACFNSDLPIQFLKVPPNDSSQEVMLKNGLGWAKPLQQPRAVDEYFLNGTFDCDRAAKAHAQKRSLSQSLFLREWLVINANPAALIISPTIHEAEQNPLRVGCFWTTDRESLVAFRRSLAGPPATAIVDAVRAFLDGPHPPGVALHRWDMCEVKPPTAARGLPRYPAMIVGFTSHRGVPVGLVCRAVRTAKDRASDDDDSFCVKLPMTTSEYQYYLYPNEFRFVPYRFLEPLALSVPDDTELNKARSKILRRIMAALGVL